MQVKVLGKILAFVAMSCIDKSDTHVFMQQSVSLASKTDDMLQNKSLVEMVSGQKHGIERTIGSQGQLIAKTHFSFDKRNGTYETWYESGGRKSFAVYENGRQVGSEWQWHLNGKLYRLAEYESSKETKVKMWRETGEIYANYVIEGDRLLGLAGGQKCDSPKSKLPFFSSIDLSPAGSMGTSLPVDFVPLTVSNFQALDQNETRLGSDSFRGKISIVNRFFIKCNGICPLIMSRIKSALDKLYSVKNLVAISITSDPNRDDPAALFKYSAMRGMADYSWRLLTALQTNSKSSIALASFSPLSRLEDLISKGDIHTENVYLFDQDTKLRGIYNSASQADMDNLVLDVQTL